MKISGLKCPAIIEDYYDDDHGDDGCDDNGCSYYDDAQCAGNCHHDQFKKTMPLKEKFGNNVKTCCSGHQYFFFDTCEVCNKTKYQVLLELN
jgi:hypothetical protein